MVAVADNPDFTGNWASGAFKQFSYSAVYLPIILILNPGYK
jgi:hypothetical protein